MQLSIPAAAMLLNGFRRSRLDAQRLLHLVPASDPASLVTVRLMLADHRPDQPLPLAGTSPKLRWLDPLPGRRGSPGEQKPQN